MRNRDRQIDEPKEQQKTVVRNKDTLEISKGSTWWSMNKQQ